MKKSFTLLEVVVAIAILALSLAGLLQLLISAQNRMARTHEKWNETHMLMQAAEYYLLQKGEEPETPPQDVFPYKGYSTMCLFRDAENLPESYTSLVGQLPLRACEIQLLRTRDGKTVDSVIVDRIQYDTSATNAN